MLNLSTALLLTTLIGAQGAGCPMMSAGSGMNMPGMGMMDGGMTIMRYARMLHNPNLVSMLDLTEDQEKKLDALRYSHEDKVLEIKQKIEREELALQRAMDQEDKAKIEARIKSIGSLRMDLELAHVGLFFELKDILTPEQMEHLNDMHMGAGGCGRSPAQGMSPYGADEDMNEMPGMNQ